MVMSSCVYANIEAFKSTDPEFAEFFGAFAYGDAIKESKLDARTRYLAIIATLLGCQGTAYLGLGRTFPFIGAANDVLESRGVSLPLPPASTTTPENRVEKGNAAQVEIFGEGMRGFQNGGTINRWLAGNCFGDYYTRKGLTLKEREMTRRAVLTFCYIAAQGGCEPQLIAHAKGNMNMGNDKEFLLDVVSQCLPYIGYPRSLNAISCINKAVE